MTLLNICEAISLYATRTPDHAALITDADSLSWCQLQNVVTATVEAFRDSGVQPGDRIAAVTENPFAFVATCAAAFLLAAVSVSAAGSIPALAEYCAHGSYLSLYLAIFNMLPVPPLDGSKLLLAARVPTFIYRELAQFGFLLLVALMVATNMGYWMSDGAYQGARLIFQLFS